MIFPFILKPEKWVRATIWCGGVELRFLQIASGDNFQFPRSLWLPKRKHQRVGAVRRWHTAGPRAFFGFDHQPASRINFEQDAGKLPDGCLVDQAINLVTLEHVRDSLVEK